MDLTQDQLPVLFLHPGEYYISREPEIVITILGSCISVVLYSRRHNICGITHSLLPKCSYDPAYCRNCDESFRYVDCSIIRLIQLFNEKGISTSDMEAKLFGGAGLISRNPGIDNVGSQNIDSALATLSKEGIKIVARDTGGTRGRKMILYSHTREVLINKLNGNKN